MAIATRSISSNGPGSDQAKSSPDDLIGLRQTVPPGRWQSVDDVYRRCRDLGMRLSRQRRMVLDLLWAEKSHLSARDIFEKLNDQGRNIGHTSVYQNLEALQSAGMI